MQRRVRSEVDAIADQTGFALAPVGTGDRATGREQRLVRGDSAPSSCVTAARCAQLDLVRHCTPGAQGRLHLRLQRVGILLQLVDHLRDRPVLRGDLQLARLLADRLEAEHRAAAVDLVRELLDLLHRRGIARAHLRDQLAQAGELAGVRWM